MFLDVEQRIKRRNQILFSHDSLCLQELRQRLGQQSHRMQVLWALDCAKVPLARFEEKYPEERRPRLALELCEAWAKGQVKMPIAKRAILDCHAVAKEIDDRECIALCHAIGQAGAVVHTGGHAMGLPMYELTAVVVRCGMKRYEGEVLGKIGEYLERLEYWRENVRKVEWSWAGFLIDKL